MKFYLDENFPPDLLGIVRLIYDDHEFVSWRDEKLGGATNIDSVWTLPERGYSAIITRDRRQLSNVDEKSALLDSGLIWVGVRRRDAQRAREAGSNSSLFNIWAWARH